MAQPLRAGEVMGPEAFLAFVETRPSGERWELHGGVARMMVGGTARHARISGNIDHGLFEAARHRGCEILRGLLVEADSVSSFEPDLIIRCGGLPDQSRSVSDPAAVFEVLSPSTMRYDRGLKFDLYRALPSLRQIVFVYGDSVRVESWLRRDESWADEPVVLTRRDDSLAVPVIGASLPLAEIYRDVTPSPLE